MSPSYLPRVLAIVAGLVALLVGMAIFAWSQTEMLWLIAWVGEEYPLGETNVIRVPGQGTYLTNPLAMIGWMMPFVALGSSSMGLGMLAVIEAALKAPTRAQTISAGNRRRGRRWPALIIAFLTVDVLITRLVFVNTNGMLLIVLVFVECCVLIWLVLQPLVLQALRVLRKRRRASSPRS